MYLCENILFLSPRMNPSSLFLGIALSVASLQASATAPSEKFLEQMGLSQYTSITYQSDDGSEISSDEFFKLAFSGRSFSTERDPETHEAILKLGSLSETAPRESKSKLSIGSGEPMPKTTLKDTSGTSHILGGGDKPLLISFFFSQCAPCIREIPELNEFARSNAAIDVVAVTFDSDRKSV